ncbi:hypothetical protein [Leisingera thetidis]|uniref:hypothetical protein n=1 Tax=Leisingera thetidis TaxID=2930199 RepID=UPI00331373E8
MHRDLIDDGHKVGCYRTARHMRANGLVVRPRRRFKRTSGSEHAWIIAPSLFRQNFNPVRRHSSFGCLRPVAFKRRVREAS